MKLKQHFSRQITITFQLLCAASLLLSSILMITGCQDTIEINDKIPAIVNENSFTLSASMPEEDATATRSTASQTAGSKSIELRWKEGDEIQLYFKTAQGFTQGEKVPVENISADGKKAEFKVNVPQDIDNTYDLYGVHGVESNIIDGKLYLDARPTLMMPLKDIQIPIYFKLIDHTKNDAVVKNVSFEHYGALQMVTIKNNEEKKKTLRAPEIVSNEQNKWYYTVEEGNATQQPVFDIENGNILYMQAGFSTTANLPPLYVNQSDNLKLAQWVVPNNVTPPAITFKASIDGTDITTSVPKEARRTPLEVRNAYHLYTLWNGKELSFTDENTTLVNKITMTTTRSVGTFILLYIYADNAELNNIWIDLNDNGERESDENLKTGWVSYAIGSQTISIYGKVTTINCSYNALTSLDASGCSALELLNCYENALTILNVKGCTALSYLDCDKNKLTSLDVSGCTALKDIFCFENALTILNVKGCTALSYLDCNNNKLTSLDVSGCTALKDLNCYENALTILNVKGCTSLSYLDCDNNKLTSLDVSGCTALTRFYCLYNELTSLDATGCISLNYLYCYSNKISGTAMDNLLESLPDLSTASYKGYIRLINVNPEYEENICTKAQVEMANAKNWKVYYSNGIDYYGS